MEGEEMQNAKCKMQNWDLSGKLVCLWKVAFLKKSLAKNFVELTRNSREACTAFAKSGTNCVVTCHNT